MSFFDEADEPRTAQRSVPRRRPPGGGGRSGGRPPIDQQAIRVRRGAALGVLVVVVVLLSLLVHSCQVSARNNALKDYNSNLVSVIQQSNATGRQFFGVLTGGGNAGSVRTSINQARSSADQQLSRGKGFDVPDEDKQTQQYLLLVLRMRRDALGNIAQNIEQALGGSTRADAVNTIASEMARLYASDALYKDYTLPLDLGALRSAGIAVGGINGQPIEGGQFVPDVRWLSPTFVASQLHVNLPSAGSGKVAPGLHGHSLASVTVNGTTLTAGGTATLTASPPPTFTLNFANTGTNTETNVICKVTVGAGKASGQTIVPQTTAGQQTSCDVPLSSSPAAGTYTVVAQIAPVPGEKNTQNNSESFTITFK